MDIEKLKKYFSYKYRGQYYVAMKVIVAKELRKKGLTIEDIAKIIYNNKKRSDTIAHYLYKAQPFHDFELVEENYKGWIDRGFYPISVEKRDNWTGDYIGTYKLEEC